MGCYCHFIQYPISEHPGLCKKVVFGLQKVCFLHTHGEAGIECWNSSVSSVTQSQEQETQIDGHVPCRSSLSFLIRKEVTLFLFLCPRQFF